MRSLTVLFVALVAFLWTSAGCSGKKRRHKGTATPPTADFEASPRQGSAPLEVHFTDKSQGTITNWEWDFDGDGTFDLTYTNKSIPREIKHTYNNPGFHTVTLRVSGPGGEDTCTKTAYIYVAAAIWYVDAINGDDSNSGTSPQEPFATLSKALSMADDHHLILVADGTYNGDLNRNLSFNGKKACIKSQNGPTNCIIDCEGQGRAFVFANGETEETVVEGLTIKNGKVTDENGGAILCTNGNPTVRNTIFIDCCAEYQTDGGAGGAIACEGSQAGIGLYDCRFEGNRSYVGECGGAVLIRDNAQVIIEDCVFTNNHSGQNGGGLAVRMEGTAVVRRTVFYQNSSDYRGGALHVYNDVSLTVEDCVFEQNETPIYGGAISLIMIDYNLVQFKNCIFAGNHATKQGDGDGGAVEMKNAYATFLNCIFTGNRAEYYGGVFACWYGSVPDIINCVFYANYAANLGGVVASYRQGSHLNTASWPKFYNCIFWENSAGNGGNIAHCFTTDDPKITFQSCCMISEAADPDRFSGDVGDIETVALLELDSGQTPGFIDEDGADNTPGTSDDDFRLTQSSPCVDAGDNSLLPATLNTDAYGNSRIVDGDGDGNAVVDMGPYELQ